MALLIGWLGMSLIVIGTYVPGENSRWFFLAGTITLGVTAILGKSRFYTALQIPIIIGAIIALLPAEYHAVGLTVLCLAAVAAVYTLASRGELRDWQSKIGVLGLLLLSGGFASGTKAWLLPANLTLLFTAAYRLKVKNEKIAIVWLVLEILATGGTLLSLLSHGST